jgi:predicted DNA binding protein
LTGEEPWSWATNGPGVARAHLDVELPAGTWIRAVTTAFPDLTVRVLATFATDAGVGLARFVGEDVNAALDAVRAAPDVTALDVLETGDGTALVRFETDRPVLVRAAQAVGVPLEPPVTVAGGRADLVVTAPADRLAALRTAFEDAGLSFEVRAVYREASPDAARPLTDRQHRVLAAAAERGYYETPRRTTLTALAADLGVAKSTLSEVLHRAEGTLVDRYLDGTPPPGE